MNVTNVKGCAVTVDTAGTKRGKTALMGQLCKGVVLVHKLRKRRGTEELTDRRGYRAGVDERRGSHFRGVVHRHTLLDILVHTRHTDAKLVLEKLSDATQTAVAEMVDVVGGANTVREVEEVVNGG